MTASGRIARNTTYLTIASIIQKIVSFAYFAYLARELGESDLGKYSVVLSFTSIFIIFMDFGLGPLLTREGAKNEHNLKAELEKIFSIKLLLMAVSLIVMIVTINAGNFLSSAVDSMDVTLVYAGAIVIILDTITFTYFSILRALKQLHWEALGILLYQGTIFICGGLVLYYHLPLPFVMGALACGSFIQTVYMAIVVKKKTGLTLPVRIRTTQLMNVLSVAAPFAVAGVIFRLNGSADSIMLKLLAGDSYAGWYALAFKLTFALTVLPGAFATSYFPAISSYYTHAKEKLASTVESGLTYMFVLSLPIVGGVLVLGDNIILSVWGKAWEASIEPLWILMLGLPFVFLNYPVGNFLNAVDKQKLNTLNMGIALVVNIVLNALLIPYFTFNGAAIALVVSSIVLVALGLPWVYRISQFSWSRLGSRSIRVLMAALAMSFVLFFIQDQYPLLFSVLIGGVVYSVLIILLNAITTEELMKLKSGLKKRSTL